MRAGAVTAHVGLDLAWGERSPTGVAVLDAAGRLAHLTAARSDDDVVAAVEAGLARAGGGPPSSCVVGIDAPLVVVNPTGSRPAEQELGRDFRRFQAGCHPSNTGKPEFAHGTRGARVAARLGLPIDHLGPGPRAIEVYPHAAAVALFDLERILRYKAKPGRDLELLRAELLRLIDLVASVVDVTGHPDGARAWADLRAAAASSPTKAGLRRVEDPVDAVLCAHVARLADLDPAAVVHYGDAATGVITTPRLGSRLM